MTSLDKFENVFVMMMPKEEEGDTEEMEGTFSRFQIKLMSRRRTKREI
jgi:hypothetical protein